MPVIPVREAEAGGSEVKAGLVYIEKTCFIKKKKSGGGEQLWVSSCSSHPNAQTETRSGRFCIPCRQAWDTLSYQEDLSAGVLTMVADSPTVKAKRGSQAGTTDSCWIRITEVAGTCHFCSVLSVRSKLLCPADSQGKGNTGRRGEGWDLSEGREHGKKETLEATKPKPQEEGIA